jgi:hypothetical protein
MTKHAFDDPDLDDRSWLELLRRDETIPINLRLDAARFLLRMFGNSPWPEPVAYTLHIPPMPAASSPPACAVPGIPQGAPPGIDPVEFQRDMAYIRRCYELNILPVYLGDLTPEGNA